LKGGRPCQPKKKKRSGDKNKLVNTMHDIGADTDKKIPKYRRD
jgi:hypothetical protein